MTMVSLLKYLLFLGSPYQAYICLMMVSVLYHLIISPAEFWVKRQYLLQLSLNDNFVVTRVPSCFCGFQYDYFIQIFITHLPADSSPAGKQAIHHPCARKYCFVTIGVCVIQVELPVNEKRGKKHLKNL